MPTLYTQVEKNIRKTWFLISFVLTLIILLFWVFSRAYGNPLILYAGVVFSFIFNFISYWYSDKIVLKISKAVPANRENEKELFRIVENLSIASGFPTPKIYIIEDQALNAFATGRNPKNGVIAVTRGLLNRLEKLELEGVIAHELSHIANRDILISTIVVVLVGALVMISDWFLRWGFFFGGRNRDERGGGGIIMIVGILLSILAPILAILIQLAVSRKREFLADASGALLTRYPDGLINALRKISGDNTPLKSANHASAHLYIANPFKGKDAASFMTKLFSTHPPIEERIAALRNLEIR